MEGYGYEHFGADGARESQQVDYRRIVGDTQPPHTNVSAREVGQYVRQTSHGHETAAQRYSATRIQAGLGPERWVTGKVYGEWATFRYNSSSILVKIYLFVFLFPQNVSEKVFVEICYCRINFYLLIKIVFQNM